MRTFSVEMVLAGLLVLGGLGGCTKDEDTSVGDTDTEDTNVPANETDCNDGDDEDQDGDEDCLDSDCAGDPDCVFTIKSISATGAFAYDATNDEIVGVVLAGSAIPPIVEISLGNEDYQTTGAEEDMCVIDLIYTGVDPIQPANWETSAGSYLGFIMPEGKYDIETNCESLDEEALGTIEQIAASGWGVGVGPEEGGVADILDDAVTSGDMTEEDRALYFGGGFYWGLDGIPDEFMDQSFAFGYEIDAEFNILNADGDIAAQNDPAALISAVDFFAGALPPSGYYQTTSLGVWAFQ